MLGLITIVATWQLLSLVLAAQSSPVLPPVPSSKVTKTAVVPRGYSGLVEDRRQVAGQPRVALGDGAVVHVIDQVRRDERERWQRVARQVGRELGVRHVIGGTAGQRRVVGGGLCLTAYSPEFDGSQLDDIDSS